MPVPYSTYDLTFIDKLPLVERGSALYRPLREKLNQLFEGTSPTPYLQVHIAPNGMGGRKPSQVAQNFRNAGYNWANAAETRNRGKQLRSFFVIDESGGLTVVFFFEPYS